jgi:hypothetical protein
MWLFRVLIDEPQPANEVVEDAQESGISERTLNRVNREAGVTSIQQPDGKWAWSLPQEAR